MKNGEEKTSRGFSGISTMVSDVNDTVEIVKNQTSQATMTRDQDSVTSQGPINNAERTVTFNQSSKTSTSNAKLKWLVGVGAIIALYFAFNSGGHQKQNSNPAPSPYAAAAPAKTSQSANAVLETAKNRDSSPIKPEELKFEMPPVGKENTLNLPQLRWYFREKIRIETMRNLAANNKAIGEFNAMVDNYNSRCGSFRYKQSSMNQAQREVDAIRDQIVAEAKRDAGARGW